jgi:drug/metabolite transporter (DMT)-like permease
MGLYLGIAVAASALLAAGLVMMKSRAEVLPEARGRAVVRAILAWIRDPLWLCSIAVQCAGYTLYVVSLYGAPVSLVAVMMQGGIALFVLFAIVFLGEHARPVEWVGIGGVVLAMLMLALSLGASVRQGPANTLALEILSVVLIAGAATPRASIRLRQTGPADAIAAGVAFGLAALYVKALTTAFSANGPRIAALAASPYLYLAIAGNVVGLVALQNGFHRARGIVVMPLSSALSNLIPIVGGILAFGEYLPHEPFAAALRIASFALTIAAGALLSAAREGDHQARHLPLTQTGRAVHSR